MYMYICKGSSQETLLELRQSEIIVTRIDLWSRNKDVWEVIFLDPEKPLYQFKFKLRPFHLISDLVVQYGFYFFHGRLIPPEQFYCDLGRVSPRVSGLYPSKFAILFND